MLDFYRRADRAAQATHPDLSDPRLDQVEVSYGTDWLSVHRGRYRVVVNLANERRTIGLDAVPVDVLLTSEPGFIFARREITLPPESVAVVTCL